MTIRTHEVPQFRVPYHVVRRVLVAERPPAVAAVMLRERKIRHKIRAMVFPLLPTDLRWDSTSSRTKKCVHGCERERMRTRRRKVEKVQRQTSQFADSWNGGGVSMWIPPAALAANLRRDRSTLRSLGGGLAGSPRRSEPREMGVSVSR
jgi:hypothetical protein